MVWDFTCFSTSQVPGDVHRHFQFQQGHTYVPAVTIDEFHVRNDQINHVPSASMEQRAKKDTVSGFVQRVRVFE